MKRDARSLLYTTWRIEIAAILAFLQQAADGDDGEVDPATQPTIAAAEPPASWRSASGP